MAKNAPSWLSFSAPDKSFTATVPATPKQTESGKVNLWRAQADKASIYMFGYTKIDGLKKLPPAPSARLPWAALPMLSRST